mmetsp:Transcript_2072/g.5557  ORF Transcript_2072/g.5557 Transcript_2072/m.5557 type:complete len:311 (-) Transcript_2072:861-1793(-)
MDGHGGHSDAAGGRDSDAYVSAGIGLASFAREVESLAEETAGDAELLVHAEPPRRAADDDARATRETGAADSAEGHGWLELPTDIKQRVFAFFSLEELFQLREINSEPALRQEIRLRIRRLLPLYEGWLAAPLEHRNLIEYRDRNNRLRCTPREFANLTRVVLGGLGLRELPASVGDMRNLVVLYLDENRLSKLPDEIKLCSHLRVLDLMSNEFVTFPNIVLTLRDVTFFSISFNKHLRFLPDNIGECFPHIQGFGGFGCSLEYLPDSLLRRLDRNPRSFANVQYNSFGLEYVLKITNKYPSLRRKMAVL